MGLIKLLTKVNYFFVLNVIGFFYLVINSLFFEGEREFKESFWMSDKVQSTTCKSGRYSEHTMLVDSGIVIIIVIDSLSCNTLKSFIQLDNIDIKVEHGYGSTPYTGHIIANNKEYITSENMAFGSGKYFGALERLLLIYFSIYFFVKFTGPLRKSTRSIGARVG